MPLLFGLALMASPLIRFMYGSQYLPAIRVLQVAAVLAIVKPLATPIDSVFKATGRQKQMLIWTTICAFLNVLLDYLLIPHLGAVGAAIGSGVALSSCVIICMFIGKISFEVPIQFGSMAKITLASFGMALPILPLNAALPPLLAVVLDPIAGAMVFFVLVRLLNVLNSTDIERLGHLQSDFPAGLAAAGGESLRDAGQFGPDNVGGCLTR